MVLHLGSSQSRLLVEAKNVKRITEQDLVKFHRDLEACAADVHAGLFVSCKDISLIHGYSKVHLEVRHGMPVVYLGGVQEFPQALQLGVLVLEQLIKSGLCKTTGVEDDSSEESEELEHRYQTVALECASRLVADFYRQQALIAKDKKILQSLELQIEAREKAAADLGAYRDQLSRVFPTLDERASLHELSSIPVAVGKPESRKQPTVPKEKLVAWLKKHGSRKTGVKELAQAFSIQSHRSITNAGGINLLKQEAFGPEPVLDIVPVVIKTSEEEPEPEPAEGVVESGAPSSPQQSPTSPFQNDPFLDNFGADAEHNALQE